MADSTIKNYFNNLKKLIHIEWEAERKFYLEKLKKLTKDEKRAQGYSWYPLEIEESGFGLGQMPFLILKRTKGLNYAHQFKGGTRVILKTEIEFQDGELIGNVHWVEKDRIKIYFNRDRIPDWLFKSTLILDAFFDERTYQAMDAAMSELVNLDKSRTLELTKALIGIKEPSFLESKFHYKNIYLNEAQNVAVESILRAEDFSVVHGPPGTGKTTTISKIIKKLSQTEKSILVCAPSNTAIDHLCLKLAEQNIHVLRIGNLSRMHNKIQEYTLESQINEHPDTKGIKKMKKEAQAIRKKARTFKRSFGKQEAHERRSLFNEAKELSKLIRIAENHVVHKLIDNAEVICCTLVGADSRYLKNLKFKTVVIDEAAQALEPACWIPILKASRVLMAGDPFQLPPTVKSSPSSALNITLMEKLVKRALGINLLNIQYRMHEDIMGFSSLHFYKGALVAADSVKNQELQSLEKREAAIEFVDTAGCGYDEQQNPSTLSTYNPEEYNLLGLHLTKLLSNINVQDYKIAIISPYREQVKYIKEHIKDHFKEEELAQIDINTIDAFQGQEKDIIYISMVRSNDRAEIGFLKDYRRTNVAMTRAKMKMVMIGNSVTFGNDPFYSKMIDYFQEKDAYTSAWEYIS